MTFEERLAEIIKLSVDERILLAEAIWDSIADDDVQVDLSDDLKREFDRRIASYYANPSAAIPWEQVKAEALARSRR